MGLNPCEIHPNSPAPNFFILLSLTRTIRRATHRFPHVHAAPLVAPPSPLMVARVTKMAEPQQPQSSRLQLHSFAPLFVSLFLDRECHDKQRSSLSIAFQLPAHLDLCPSPWHLQIISFPARSLHQPYSPFLAKSNSNKLPPPPRQTVQLVSRSLNLDSCLLSLLA